MPVNMMHDGLYDGVEYEYMLADVDPTQMQEIMELRDAMLRNDGNHTKNFEWALQLLSYGQPSADQIVKRHGFYREDDGTWHKDAQRVMYTRDVNGKSNPIPYNDWKKKITAIENSRIEVAASGHTPVILSSTADVNAIESNRQQEENEDTREENTQEGEASGSQSQVIDLTGDSSDQDDGGLEPEGGVSGSRSQVIDLISGTSENNEVFESESVPDIHDNPSSSKKRQHKVEKPKQDAAIAAWSKRATERENQLLDRLKKMGNLIAGSLHLRLPKLELEEFI
ncbi:hypothetical protein P280DRAFT_523974 [Massarina eburnea CBS 473.64]|uniref:Uncharacterized protein n=1 Tax=Massarina eburnea CBS 473.64 TaxID=1395130 RepID=A0A6A6RHJ7_9PLEO|nr:hypothetical protein P280DRAFT_523974 [Massarina eburnea CBS 473.64]